MVELEAEKATDYFHKLFTSCTGTRTEKLLEHVAPRISEEMNIMLTKEYTAEEVAAALKCIGDLKASDLDGMPAIFYKRYWELVGEQVTAEVLSVLYGGNIPTSWNDTCVILIPKVKQQEKMNDLRPICLCNVVYKLVSKVIANRLILILPEITAPNQSAFVPGHLITITYCLLTR